ncbi:MAG: leucine-rich repeat protein [Finegoldia sp.]|nr:leucine-rich repeat protein [Finegoldia sp.]
MKKIYMRAFSFFLSVLMVLGQVSPVLAADQPLDSAITSQADPAGTTGSADPSATSETDPTSVGATDPALASEPEPAPIAEPETTPEPQPEPAALADPAQEEFVINDQGELIQWNRPDSFDGSLVIPDGVKIIGANVFSNQGIKSLTLNADLVEIKDGAFSDNKIKELALPEGLTTIGKDAFRNNDLTSLDFPDSLETIGASAFQDNSIKELNLNKVVSIGDQAFRSNDLTEVNIPDSVESFGSNIFLDNNRYVKVVTQNPIVTSEITTSNYGHVLNPVTVRIHFIDKDTNKEIIDPKIIGADLTDLGAVFEEGKESTYVPEQITGYLPTQSEVKFTPKASSADYFDVNVYYIKSDKKPVLEVGVINFVQNESVDKAKLLSFVTKAEDALGNDLKAKVTVSPETIDTSTPGKQTVSYSVTDANGNTTSLQADVYVAMDWKKVEVGGGYLVEDFIFGFSDGKEDNENGDTILGFSESGLLKAQTNPDLYLPTINYSGKPVTIVGERAFLGVSGIQSISGKGITSAMKDSFEGLYNLKYASFPDLTYAADNSFTSNANLEEISMPALKEISGHYIFSQNWKLKKVYMPSLTTVSGTYNFYDCGELTDIYMPALRKVSGSSNFAYLASLTELNLPSLEEISGDYVFQNNRNLAKISMPALKTISGRQNFAGNSKLLELDLPALEEVSGELAFYELQIEDLSLPALKKISGDRNFAYLLKITEFYLPSLEEISGEGNFSENPNLTKISMPALKTISGTSTFGSTEMLSEIDLPALEVISGDHNFTGSNLPTELKLPSLKSIDGQRQFYNSDNTKNYFYIYGDPSVETVARENWILNPDKHVSEEDTLTDDDIIWQNDDPSTGTMIGIKGAAYSKIKNAGGKVVLPASVQVIGGTVFYNSPDIVSIRGENVKSIKASSVFQDAYNLAEIDFPSLTTIEGDYNFYNLPALTRLYLPSLTSIVGYNNLNNLYSLTDLSLPALTSISGNHNFYGLNSLTELNLPSLISISGANTFSSDTAKGSNLKRISLPKLRTISGFQNFGYLKNLTDISMPELTSISDKGMLYGAEKIENIYTPKLVEIKKSGKSNSINKSKQKTIWTISDDFQGGVTELTNFVSSFRSASSNNPVTIYTVNRTNKNNIQAVANFYIINPVEITFEYVDEDGEKIYPDKIIQLPDNQVYTPTYPLIAGYKTPEVKTIDPSKISGGRYTERVVYTKYTEQELAELRDRTQSISFRHYYQEANKDFYYISDPMTSRVAFDLSGFDADISGYTIKIEFDESVVDINSINLPQSSEIIVDHRIEGSALYLTLGNVSGGTSLDYPITWKFKKYVTPENTPYPFTASIYDTNDLLYAYTDPLYFKGWYRDPNFTKTHNNGAQGYIYTDNVERYGEGVTDFVVSNDERLVYNFQTSYVERKIGAYTVTDPLPHYTDKDGNSLLAKFDPNENPSWELSEDGKSVTYKGNANNSTTINIPNLILRVPGAKLFTTIKNEASIELVPFNKTEFEDNMVEKSSVTHHYAKKEPSGQIFIKDIKMPHVEKDGESYFYDAQIERDLEYGWLLHYNVANQTDILDSISFKDYGIDNRMYYTGVSIPSELDGATISLYKGDQVIERDVLSGDEKYEIPTSIQRDVTSLVIERSNASHLLRGGTVEVYTRLREPDKSQYDPTAGSDKNVYFNSADAVLNLTSGTKTFSDKEQLNLRYLDQKIKARKVTDFESDIPLYPGNQGSYTIGVERASELIGDVLKDFEMIDLLPVGLNVDSVELLGEFAQSPTKSYQIIENYNNSGQTAIIFKAEELDTTQSGAVENIAKINVTIDEMIPEGNFTNDVFLHIGNESVSLVTPVKDPRLDDGEYSKAFVTRSVLKSKELTARKYISKDGTYWSKDGIKTESLENFLYKLTITNGTGKDRSGMAFIDILPFAGDTAIVENQSGERVSRDSQFNNTFDYQKGISLPEDYDIYYLNEPVPALTGTIDDAENTWNWQTTGSEKTTAIKIVAKEGTALKANSKLDIIIPMIAPDNSDGSLDGMRAYNTYVRKDDITGRFIEPNRVYNEVPAPRGTITLTKVSGSDKLQGAIFGLWDAEGNFIEQKTSDVNGFISFNDLDTKKDYLVKEMKAPDGYVLDQKEIQVKASDFLRENNFIKDLGTINNNRQWAPIQPVRGNLSFTKVDKDGSPLEGISFNLKGKDSWNQYINITAKSDSQGKVRFDALEAGKYTLTEVGNTNLMPITSREVSISASVNGVENTLSGVLSEGKEVDKIVNDKGRLTVVKLGILDDKKDIPVDQMQAAYGTKLQGVELSLYKGDTPVNAWTTNSNGEVVFDNLDLDTVYTIKETKKHPDYSIIYDEVNFKIDKTGKLLTEDGKNFISTKLYLPNLKEKKESLVSITKKDNAGNLLEGVEFGLYKKVDGDFQLQAKKTTGSDGIVTFDKLTGGIYQIKEEQGLPNYFIDNKIEEFSVDDYTQKTFTYEYVNKKLDLSVRKISYVKKFITKEEADKIVADNPDQGLLIEQDKDLYNVYKNVDGAKFELREKDGTVLGEFSSVEGKIDFGDFKFDTSKNYDLVEIQAPAGYVLDKTVKPLNIRDYSMLKDFDGKINITLENKPVKGKVIVSKFKNLDKQPLEGTLFEIRTKDGVFVKDGVTDKTGDVIFDNLDLGDYIISEKEPSPGYERNESEVTVSLTEDNNIAYVSFYNRLAIDRTLPVTGLTYSVAVLGMLIVFMGVACYFLKKNKKTI